jgi:hypothetical protein
MDNLSRNHSPDAVHVIVSIVLQRTVMERIQWLGLKRWRMGLSHDVEACMNECIECC